MTGQLPCKLKGSVVASGCKLKNSSASPFLGFTAKKDVQMLILVNVNMCIHDTYLDNSILEIYNSKTKYNVDMIESVPLSLFQVAI